MFEFPKEFPDISEVREVMKQARKLTNQACVDATAQTDECLAAPRRWQNFGCKKVVWQQRKGQEDLILIHFEGMPRRLQEVMDLVEGYMKGRGLPSYIVCRW